MTATGRMLACLLLSVLLAACGKPRSTWRVLVEPSGGWGAVDASNELRAIVVRGTISDLNQIFQSRQFWRDYFNSPDDPHPLFLEDLQVRSPTWTDNRLLRLKISFVRVEGTDDQALAARLSNAYARYRTDQTRAQDQAALEDLRARYLVEAGKAYPTAQQHAEQLRQRLREAEAISKKYWAVYQAPVFEIERR